MGEIPNNNQIEQLKNNISVDNLDGLRDLLDYFKSGEVYVQRAELDVKNNMHLVSKTEKSLVEPLKNLDDINSQVRFFGDLIKKVEAKKNSKEKKTEKTTEILDKKINQMSLSEAKEALKYTQKNRSKIINKLISFGSETINSLNTKGELNKFQEKLIEKVYGINNIAEAGFNDNYLVGYSSEKGGNYVVGIPDFEATIGKRGFKAESIDFFALTNYFQYLAKNGFLNGKYIVEKLGNNPDFLKSLQKIWNSKGNKYSKKAKEILIRYNKKKNLEIEKLEKEIFEIVNNPKGKDLKIEIGGRNKEIIALKDQKIDFSIFEDIKKVELEKKRMTEITDYNDKMANKENDYYLRFPGKISFILKKEKLDLVLAEFQKSGKKLNLSFINPMLLQQYVLNDNVKIEDKVDLDSISDDILKTKFGEILSKLSLLGEDKSLLMFEEIVKKLLVMGIDKKVIANALEGFNINQLSHLGFTEKLIEKYNLREREIIGDSEFLELKREYLENKSLNGEKYKNLTSYITGNISNSSVMDFAINMIKNRDYGFNNLLLYIPNKPKSFSRELIKSDFKNIVYIDKILRGDKEIIAIFLDGVSNGKQEEIRENLEYFRFLKPKNVNRGLQIIKYFIEVAARKEGKDFSKLESSEEKQKIVESMNEFGGALLSDSSFGSMMTGISHTNGNLIESEYKELYEILTSSFKKLDLNREVNASEAIYEKFKKEEELKQNNTLNQGREKLLEKIINDNGIEKDTEKDLIKQLVESNDEKTFNTLRPKLVRELSKRIKKEKELYAVYDKIIAQIKDYGIEESEKILAEVKSTTRFNPKSSRESFYLDEDGKEDWGEVVKDISNYVNKRKERDKNAGKPIKGDSEYAREFIEDNFDTNNIEKVFAFWKANNKKLKAKEYLANREDNLQYDIHRAKNPNYTGNFEEFKQDLETGKIKANPLVSEIVAQNNLELGISNTNLSGEYIEKVSVSGKDYSLDTKTGLVSDGNNTLTLDDKEKKIIEANPEALENIFDFYRVLDRVGLKKLWNRKSKIFRSISNVNGIAFKEDSDYLNENEIKIFLNSILVSVGEKEIPSILGKEDFLSKIEILNKRQFLGEEKKTAILEETTLEKKFFDKFIGKDRSSIIGFKNAEFEKALSTKAPEKD